MYAIAIIRYRKPLDEVLAVVEPHRAYLRELHAQGILLASGPMEPRNGGILFLRLPEGTSLASLDAIRDGDPYVQAGVAQYELVPWNPNIGVEGLERL